MVEEGVSSLDENTEEKVLKIIFSSLITDDNIGDVLDYLKKYVR